MKTDKGILIIACGHPFYGRMALNLAASIKSVEPGMNIALRHAGSAVKYIDQSQMNVFDDVALIDESIYLTDKSKNNWIRTKLFLYDLSPFDKTIFIDADTLWLPKRKPSDLFDDLKDITLTFANYKRHDFNTVDDKERVWANIKEVKDVYKLDSGYYYCLQSEMIYFTRTDDNRTFFEMAKIVYDNPKVKTTIFAGFVPDELAFSITMAKMGLHPHVTPYYPTYWHPVQKHVNRDNLFDRHYLLSVGGAFQTDYVKDLYNTLASVAFRKLQMETPWKYFNKRQWLPERKTI